MLPKFRKTFILVAVVAALSTGCRYQKEYSKITEAGNQYANAVDKLLDKAGHLQADYSAEKLLSDDKLANQTIENYKDAKKDTEEQLKKIAGMREHNQLLQKYFQKLRQLARSNAPEQIQAEIDGIVGNIQTISSNYSFDDKGIIGRVGKLVIDSKIDGALRKELEKRDNTILKELTIQQDMINSLRGSMEHKFELLKSLRETRLLIEPLTDEEPIEDAQAWIEEHKQMLFLDKHIAELKEACNALGDFKEIYKASVEGNINSESIDNALEDIGTFLALIDKK